MHPTHRLGIAFLLGCLANASLAGTDFREGLKWAIVWDVFAVGMLSTSWSVLCTRTSGQIRALAKVEDGSLLYVIGIVLLASLAGLVAVMNLLSIGAQDMQKAVYAAMVISGILLSWFMVHTTFTYHYARVYYSDDTTTAEDIHRGGLLFPEEPAPDYLDFAYYAFTIGMTFQVSDVGTCNRQMRRLTLLHALLSFGLNTFVVALTINLIAGLRG